VDAGVPFALLAAAQLLAVAAALCLAVSSLRRPLRTGLPTSLLIVAGGVTLAVADGWTGARLGAADNDVLIALHGGGLAAVGLGLGWGGLGLGGRFPARTAGGGMAAVAPVGAALPAAVGCAVGGLLGALGAVRRRAPGWPALASGLLILGVLGLLGPAARTHSDAAIALLSARCLGAVLVLGAVAELARSSVLSKVVYALGAGVLATAIAVAGVVGTTVSDRLGSDQAAQLRRAAAGTATDLQADATTAQQLATLASGCSPEATVIGACAASVTSFAAGNTFTAVATPGAPIRVVGGSVRLDRASLLDLAQQDAVREALADPGFVGSGFVLLHGAPEQLIALGVASHRDPDQPAAAPQIVVLYGAAIDDARLRRTKIRSTFDATVLDLSTGRVLASSLDGQAAGVLAERSRTDRVADALGPAGQAISRIGEGRTPTVGYTPLYDGTARVAALALSAPGDTVLHTQQLVLELLFTTLAVTGLVIGLGAIGLGRRAVAPVLSLTRTARTVRDGDLSARPAVSGRDEVGQLAAVFGAMTAALASTTGDLRQTAEAEAATRARLATVLDAMSDALVVSDGDGLVTVTNPAAVALLGDVVGSPVDEVLASVDGHPLREGEGWVQAVDGPVPVAVSSAPLPAGDGHVHVIRDVTDAEQLERAKTEFLANASHELRAPLTPILGYADLLRRRRELSDEQVDSMAASIAESSRRMQRVVDLLVDVAALDAGRVHATLEPVRVGPFVDGVLADWRQRVPERAGDLGRRVARGLPPVETDPHWLARAVDELVDNAIKYTPAGTAVTLTASAEGPGLVRLGVRDAGPGLDPEHRDALLTDFSQVDGSATRAHSGLGLGVPFAVRVAAVLGARPQVTSEPGRSTLFAFELPAVVAEPTNVSGTGRRNTARPRPGGPSA